MLKVFLNEVGINDITIDNRTYNKGQIIHSPTDSCDGLFMVDKGVLRIYIISPEGKEVTLYRLKEGEICLFSAACIFNSISFDIYISADTDCHIEVLPISEYKTIENIHLSKKIDEIMANRMGAVIGLVNDILWQSMDQRILNFLSELAIDQSSNTIKITHEEIALHLGTAREVVSRTLKYMEGEGLVSLSRGEIELINH